MNTVAIAMLLLMHPVRETLAEVHYNKASHCLEIALRLSLDDERDLLGDAIHSTSDDSVAIRERALEQLPRRLRFGTRALVETRSLSARQRQEQKSGYRWIGRETEGAHVWWYFEFRLRKLKRDEVFVRSELLTATGSDKESPDHRHEHANSISTFIIGRASAGKRPSFVLTPSKLTGKLPLPSAQ